MFITELFESTKKHASFCFGRMNPPTAGHEQLIQAVAQSSKGGDYFIFTSQSQDAKKNPLNYQTKVRFLRALYPSMSNHFVYEDGLKTIMQVAEWLYNKGYTSVTFVAGSDRLADFEKLLNAYNGVEGKNVYYKFDSIDFVSSGERDPDSDGVTGISASSAREAAAAGDYESFSYAVNAGHLTDKLYSAVRKGMGVEDAELAEDTSVENGKVSAFLRNVEDFLGKDEKLVDQFYSKDTGMRVWTRGDGTRWRDPAMIIFHTDDIRDYAFDLLKQALTGAKQTSVTGYFGSDDALESLTWKGKLISKYGRFAIAIGTISRIKNKNSVWREKPTNEDAAGVGVIAKNKKMAKDPRYSMSITNDVKPDTPEKMKKAFRL